jgi:predicted dithiol-disulfide oxidoreductase (DUF899 family)
MSANNTKPPIATHAAWTKARAALLAEEKALTLAQDRLAAARLRLPRQPVMDRYRCLNVFLREGQTIYRTCFTSGRGVESLDSVWSFLDITP